MHGIIGKKEKVVSIWRKKDISLLLYNGTIYSMENEVYNWVAVKDGKIYKTGCNNEYKSLLKLSKKSID